MIFLSPSARAFFVVAFHTHPASASIIPTGHLASQPHTGRLPTVLPSTYCLALAPSRKLITRIRRAPLSSVHTLRRALAFGIRSKYVAFPTHSRTCPRDAE
jgi:hypothetical protein